MRESCGTVLIVDADAGDREDLARVAAAGGFEVKKAGSSDEALEAARSEIPSAVLLEVPLPGMSGYELCRMLRDEFGGELPIVFVSGARTESYDRVAGLLVGADDYVTKPYAPDELLARVRRLVRQARLRTPGELNGSAPLTRREREVLRLLTEGLNQKEIARRLFISPKTVGTHIEHILSKLRVRNRAEAVALVYRDAVLNGTG